MNERAGGARRTVPVSMALLFCGICLALGLLAGIRMGREDQAAGSGDRPGDSLRAAPEESGTAAYRFDYDWVKYRYIAHALGGIGDDAYTNSPEAFLENYRKGYRLFEVDLIYTSDGALVGLHSWKNSNVKKVLGVEREEEKNGEPMSLQEFRSCRVYGNYTPLELGDLAKLLKNRDLYLILDGKYEEEEEVRKEYAQIRDTFSELAPELLDRLVPQIYHQDMLDWVMEIYPWKSMIYTWYQLDDADFSPLEEIRFSRDAGIRVITMDEDRENDLIDRELLKYGLIPFVHTVNDPEKAAAMEKNGVAGFYTEKLK